MKRMHKKRYGIEDFIPLIVAVLLVIAFTIVRRMSLGFTVPEAMADFMGAYFVLFAFFKIINLHGFVTAFSTYDLIARHYRLYAYAYPFIELIVGGMYLMFYTLGIRAHFVLAIVTLVLMGISALGVIRALRQKKKIECACLGGVFKLPLTYITLIENVLMAGMALVMLVKLMGQQF
jgi:hypothetical protein